MSTALLLVSFAFAAAPLPTSGVVKSVYDGDTLTLESGDKIRLKWANTPEMKPKEPCADEAKDATTRITLSQTVTLTVDSTAARDGYGRLLAAVSVGEQDLSLTLIERGLAHVYIIPPVGGDPKPYLEAQDRARAAGLCIWATDRFRGPLHITSFHANAPGDESLDPNLEYLRVANISAGDFDLQGYRIADANGNSWNLPHVVVPGGNTVILRSGKGTDAVDPSAQIVVHLGSDGPIWSNTYDKAVILAPDGTVVDAQEYHGKAQ
jgi:endonuclease YncB( thermonuclease family)